MGASRHGPEFLGIRGCSALWEDGYEGSNAQQIPQFTSVLLGLITKRLLQPEEVASRFFDLTLPQANPLRLLNLLLRFHSTLGEHAGEFLIRAREVQARPWEEALCVGS